MRYSSDLSNNEYEIIKPLIPAAKHGGRRRSIDIREVLNGIFNLLKTGCQWKMLPKDFPAWGTVHYYFRRRRIAGDWFKIHEALRAKVRINAGLSVDPATAIIDSQSVKTGEKGDINVMMEERRLKGVKAILVDKLEMILSSIVVPANIGDREGAKCLLYGKQYFLPALTKICAEGGCGEDFINLIKERTG